MTAVACWHVRDKKRLCENLRLGRCDLWSLKEDMGSWERYSAEWWFDDKMKKLKVGERVRFCCTDAGKVIVAEGTIAGRPERLDKPLDQSFRSQVKIEDIKWVSAESQVRCLERDSHRL